MSDAEKQDRDFARVLTKFKRLAQDIDFLANEIEKINHNQDEETNGYVFSHRCCAQHIRETAGGYAMAADK